MGEWAHGKGPDRLSPSVRAPLSRVVLRLPGGSGRPDLVLGGPAVAAVRLHRRGLRRRTPSVLSGTTARGPLAGPRRVLLGHVASGFGHLGSHPVVIAYLSRTYIGRKPRHRHPVPVTVGARPVRSRGPGPEFNQVGRLRAEAPAPTERAYTRQERRGRRTVPFRRPRPPYDRSRRRVPRPREPPASPRRRTSPRSRTEGAAPPPGSSSRPPTASPAGPRTGAAAGPSDATPPPSCPAPRRCAAPPHSSPASASGRAAPRTASPPPPEGAGTPGT